MCGVVQFVLYGFEEQCTFAALGVVIHAGGEQVQHLPVQHLLAGANIADAAEQFFPVVAAAQVFQAGIVHGEAFLQVLAQAFGGPDAELGAAPRFDPIAHSNDGFQVVVTQRAADLSFALLPNL